MTYALLLDSEKYLDGLRILQLVEKTFEVSEPLFWQECPIEVYHGLWYFNPTTKQFVAVPVTTSSPTTGEPPNVIE